jgi:hypothetical protein
MPNASGIYTLSDMAIVSGKFDIRTVIFRLQNRQQQTAMACLFCWYSRYWGVKWRLNYDVSFQGSSDGIQKNRLTNGK